MPLKDNIVKQNRIECIDIAKGITILLVVVGHVSSLPIALNGILYSFHMPLFFVLSGYFFRKETVFESAKRMFPSLIIPYLVVGCIMRVINITKNYINGELFDCADLLSLFGVCWQFGDKVVSVGAIWFLVVLFLSKIFLQVFLNYKYGLVYILIISTISICITRYFHFILPFGIQQACVCTLFLYVGFLCKQYKLFEEVKMSDLFIYAMLFVMIPFMVKMNIGIRSNIYQFGIFSVITSSAITIFIVLFLKSLLKYNFFKIFKPFFMWCGSYSLVILAIHSIEARFFAYHSDNYLLESFIRLAICLLLAFLYISILNLRYKFLKNENSNT